MIKARIKKKYKPRVNSGLQEVLAMDKTVEYERERMKQNFQVMKMTWLAGVVAIVLMQINIWVSDYKVILREIEELKQQVISLEAIVKRQAEVE